MLHVLLCVHACVRMFIAARSLTTCASKKPGQTGWKSPSLVHRAKRVRYFAKHINIGRVYNNNHVCFFHCCIFLVPDSLASERKKHKTIKPDRLDLATALHSKRHL
ncbi:hypothetical protein B0H66DRAFT_301223 [Apodospora peruviana]|uniref:Secreted protein n=1 Tax=Apodospora peruviana TaxID=516989 RepID=A0AAE0I2X9_9PEZI|nr:hypothetical protein B0H66DRAFT_301223 [Apodospora peruviana]